MYELRETKIEESHLHYRLEGEAAERHGAIGYMRADFGGGREFWSSWFDSQPRLKTNAFKNEFQEVIDALRNDGQPPPFASRDSLETFCAAHKGVSEFTIRTLDYSYYFRFRPMRAHYDIYCFAYDNGYLLPQLAGQHELPQYCFSVLPSTGEMIRIQRGENVYHLCNSAGMLPERVRFKVDDENGLRQITKRQEAAMLGGSMFGWDTPAAKPWNYDQNGKPRPMNQPKKDDRER
jgi:hypothetical protein